jgi:hypothetical protein
MPVSLDFIRDNDFYIVHYLGMLAMQNIKHRIATEPVFRLYTRKIQFVKRRGLKILLKASHMR